MHQGCKQKKALGLRLTAAATVILLLWVSSYGQVQVAPGVTYREIKREEIPWSIQVLEASYKTPSLALGVELGGEHIIGIEPLNHLMERVLTTGHQAVAGVNGDFYILEAGPFQGDPIGFCVENGELLSSPINRSALVILEDGSLVIDRFHLNAYIRGPDGSEYKLSGVNQYCRANGIVLITPRFNGTTRPQENSVILLAGPLPKPLGPHGTYTFTVAEKHGGDSETSIPPDRVIFIGRGTGAEFLDGIEPGEPVECVLDVDPSPGAILHAIGGGPRLLRNGKISIEASEEGITESFVETRHPRTAVGFNGKSLFLVTVDGRQEGYSAGMSLPELAGFLKELGAEDALNLDGGGSTTMWVNGHICNRPSDGRIRPIANALLLFNTSQ